MSTSVIHRLTVRFKDMPKKYYDLTKPGIIYGNLMTTAAGFLFASHFHIYLKLMLGVMSGVALVIASACVFNNIIDRDIDKKMDRTKKRALVSGDISLGNALIFATLLGMVGFFVLAAATNLLTVIVGLIGFVDYIVLYGYAKRRSPWGTLVGSISGAMPVVAGYVAIINRFDMGAWLLFLILATWQMPHFFAIAIRRYDDYERAKLPVLPVIRGVYRTKIRMILYILAFITSCVALTIEGYTGILFALVMGSLGIVWLYKGLKGFQDKNERNWAKRMFLFSLVIILVLSIMLPLGTLLP